MKLGENTKNILIGYSDKGRAVTEDMLIGYMIRVERLQRIY